MFVLLVTLSLLAPASWEYKVVEDHTEKLSDALQLTRPDGTIVWVNPHAVALVRGPLEGESGHTILVFTSGTKQAVMESVEEIIVRMNELKKGSPVD